MRTAIAIAVACLLLTGAARVQAWRDAAYPTTVALDDPLYISSPAALRRLTIGFNTLAADLYWIRAIQYYGGAKRRLAELPIVVEPPPMLADPSEFQHLYELLDSTTSLDPRFDIAYRFGSVFLAEAYPSGPGRADLAVKLLQKGIRERADKWQYMQEIGFVYYWYVGDYQVAADWFDRASQVPGSPAWLKALAATTHARGGDRRTSRAMWLAILESDVTYLRGQAEHRLLQLRALDEIDILQARVEQYAKRTGETPTEWQMLIRGGALRAIPRDPKGTPYALTTDGRVRLGDRSSLNPLPTEPERQPAS